MGSQSDWPTLIHASETLTRLGVPHETKIVSAHRTPDRLRAYAVAARDRGLKVVVAGAGGAAHLPGMCASWTSLPVLGVPVESHALKGIDSLLSIVQMPAGIPVGALAIGRAGAINAALLAAAILAIHDVALAARLDAFRAEQTAAVADAPQQLPIKGVAPEHRAAQPVELEPDRASPVASRPVHGEPVAAEPVSGQAVPGTSS